MHLERLSSEIAAAILARKRLRTVERIKGNILQVHSALQKMARETVWAPQHKVYSRCSVTKAMIVSLAMELFE